MRDFLIRLLTSADRRINRLIRMLKQANQNKTVSANVQISVKEWEQIYLNEPEPVTRLSSPIAKYLLNLSTPDDTFIEIGCGSATISAELAIEGQRIVLCDYSESILRRGKKLFRISNLPDPTTVVLNIEKPLPFGDRQYEIVWNSGVLEHWEDDELVPIVREMARISKKYVVSFVPNASSVFYRMGKYYAEQNGTWQYGKELPRSSLNNIFQLAGLKNIYETTVLDRLVISWLKELTPDHYPTIRNWWLSLSENDPVKYNQGYLLVTIGTVG